MWIPEAELNSSVISNAYDYIVIFSTKYIKIYTLKIIYFLWSIQISGVKNRSRNQFIEKNSMNKTCKLCLEYLYAAMPK